MAYLDDIEKCLDLPDGAKKRVMNELAGHYAEYRDELLAQGMTAYQADMEVARSMGDPKQIASRLGLVHNTVGWKSAILVIAPFLILAAGKFALYGLRIPLAEPLAIFALVLLGMSMIQLRRGLRPVWLASWLAAGIGTLLGFALRAGFSRPDRAQYVFVDITQYSDKWSYWWATYSLQLDFIGVLLAGGIAVWCCRNSWRHIMLVCATTLLACWLLTFNVVDVSVLLVPTLVMTPIILCIAIKLFMDADHGDITYGALFLYAYYMSLWTTPATGGLYIDMLPAWLMPVTAGAFAVVCVRQSGSAHKLWALLGGILAVSAVYGLGSYASGITSGLHLTYFFALFIARSAVCLALFLTLFILLPPVLVRQARNRQRAQIVQ